MTTIECAAVQLRDGRIIRERTHRACWQMILAGVGHDPDMLPKGREGFVTSGGDFVNPWAAATLARAAGTFISDPKKGLQDHDLDCY